VHAELGARLAQRAFGASHGERQFARFEPDERIASAHVASDLDQHLPHDAGCFGADPRLVGGHEGARQIDLALDGHPLDGRRPHSDDGAGAAPRLAAGGLGTTRSHRGDGDK
jgi:hypothetical protein